MADQVSTVVIKRDGVESIVAATPDHLKDVALKAMTPLAVVLVRGLRVYLQTAVGLMTAAPIGATLVNPELKPVMETLSSWQVALSLSVGPALVCIGQNSVELLARLDEKLPKLRP